MNTAVYTEVIWRDGSMSSHESEDTARRKAAKLSKDQGVVYAISYSGADPVRGWSYAEGRGQSIATEDLPALAERLQATIPVTGTPVVTTDEEAESEVEDTSDTTETTETSEPLTEESETEMRTAKKKTAARKAPAKKVAAKKSARKVVAAKPAPSKRAAKKPTTAPRTAVNGVPVRLTPESVCEALNSRPKTIKYEVLQKLTEKPGEPVTMKKLLVTAYGSANVEANRGNLQTVLVGIRSTINSKGVPLTLDRTEVNGETAYVLKKA